MSNANSRPANATLFHHPNAIDTSRPNLMGRHVAGEGFVRGFVRHAGVGEFFCYARSRRDFDDFKGRVNQWDSLGRDITWAGPDGLDRLAGPGTLQVPGPGIADFAWRRRGLDQRAYSICGINHTLASDSVMDSLGALLTGPVQPWDAVVCTSRAARAAILALLDEWGDYLGQRFSAAAAKPQMQLPVIPLGVDCEAFAPAGKEGVRAALRAEHGIADNDIAALYMGRLSFHAKAHPMALYLGLEEASRRTAKKIHLIQAGWFPNADIERQFREGARQFCPSVEVIFLDGREPRVRADIWFAADLFASLADNVQESFGLAPVEAMAAGLPVVVSDWDGYRDTVRHGIDGFTVPTWMPGPGAGADIVLPVAGEADFRERTEAYNQYCATVSQATALDVQASAEAFTALAGDADLRRRFGATARARALTEFDWRAVIAAHQALWTELASMRAAGDELAAPRPGRAAHPLRDDPFRLFAAYPTAALRPDIEISVPIGGGDGRLAVFRAVPMNAVAARHMMDGDAMESVLSLLAMRKKASVGDIVDHLNDIAEPRVLRGLAWMAKAGLLKLADSARETDWYGMPADRALDDDPGRLGKLGPQWQRRLAAAPGDLAALIGLALLRQAEGDDEAALELLGRGLARAPGDAVLNNALGEILAKAGRLDEAKARFRRALLDHPAMVAVHRNLGRVLALAGDSQGAADAFGAGLRIAPQDCELWYLRGVAARRLDDAGLAAECLRQCTEIDPKHTAALCQLALALRDLGHDVMARGAAVAAIDSDPLSVHALATEASLAAWERGEKNLRRDAQARKIGILLARREDYARLRPLFDILLAGHWPFMAADARDLAPFAPDLVVVRGGGVARVRGVLGGVPVIAAALEPGENAFRDEPLPRGLLDADFVCAANKNHRDRLVEGGALAANVWVTGALEAKDAPKRMARRLGALPRRG